MSAAYSPKVVTNGLVVSLDAGSVKSYPGSGSTWFDLSGNGKHGTLTNAPTWNSAGYFTDFTTNQYIQLGNSPFGVVPAGQSSRTVVMGIRTSSTLSASSGYQHIFHYGTALTDLSWGLAMFNNALSNHTWAGNSYTDMTMAASTNYIVACRYSDSATPRNTFFINGIFPGTLYGQGKTTDYSINTGTAQNPIIGSRISAPAELMGTGARVYFLHIYNRYLGDGELNQNFGAMRSRLSI